MNQYQTMQDSYADYSNEPQSGSTDHQHRSLQQTPRQPAYDTDLQDRKDNGFHIYGGKAALCISPSKSQNGETHTLNLEAARATAPKQFDWRNKVCIQLTRNELPVVAAVLFGIQEKCQFSSHGPNKTKGFSIANQTSNLYVTVNDKGKSNALPVNPSDTYWLSVLILRQLHKNTPWMDMQGIISTLARTQSKN